MHPRRNPGVSWRKSSFSNGGGQCVEAGVLDEGEVAVRHSKDPDGPVLIFTPAEWSAFVAGVKAGEFDTL